MHIFPRFILLASLSLVLVGCEGEKPAPTPSPAPAPAKPETKSAATPAPAEDDKLTAEELAEIKKLPAEDQKLAIEQKVCPVGEGHLGDPNMGAPIKVTAKGVTFFLCCEGCRPKVNKDPDAVLAKLAALKKPAK